MMSVAVRRGGGGAGIGLGGLGRHDRRDVVDRRTRGSGHDASDGHRRAGFGARVGDGARALVLLIPGCGCLIGYA